MKEINKVIPPLNLITEDNLVKYIECRGFIYLLINLAYPEYIKIGRTFSLKNRMRQYSKHLPKTDIFLVAYTEAFVDVKTVEDRIVEKLDHKYTSIRWKKEWYPIEAKDDCLQLMQSAEKYFSLCKSNN